jgi:hypothetical protein
MDCVLENRVLRTRFGLEREEVTGGWKKLGRGKGRGKVHPRPGHEGPEGE